MYRLFRAIRFDWSVIRAGTFIMPYFELGEKNQIHLDFVELRDPEGLVRGTWWAQVMDRHIKSQICRAIQDAINDWELIDPEALDGIMDYPDSE